MTQKKLLRLKQIIPNKVPLSKAKLYGMMRDGEFPKPIKYGRSSFWLESDVDKWVDELCNQSEVA